MTKLLLFAMRFPPEHVGTARYAQVLAEGLALGGVQVTVLAPQYAGADAAGGPTAYQVRRIPGGHAGFVPWRYLRSRDGLARALDEVSPDALWAANGMATRVVGTLAGRPALAIVGSVHGTDIATRLPGRTPGAWLESVPQRRFYEWADRLVVLSRFTGQLAVDKGVDYSKLRQVYLGVPRLPNLEAARRAARSRHPELAGRRVVLTVGRLVPQKGHRLLIDAMEQVLPGRPDVLHLIVGDGPERRSLQVRIQELGRQDRIRLLGRVPQDSLDDYYLLARVFALTSHAVDARVEGLGFVFLEAAARGLAAVGTRHGGIPEVIDHGRTGYLVDPARPDEIALCLAQLLDDEALCERLGRGAHQRAGEVFGEDRMVEECRRVLQEIL